MKKSYLNPLVATDFIRLQHIVCASGPKMTGVDNTAACFSGNAPQRAGKAYL